MPPPHSYEANRRSVRSDRVSGMGRESTPLCYCTEPLPSRSGRAVVALKQMDQLQLMTTEGPGGLLIMHLDGPLTLTTLFEFQDAVREQQATGLILALD